MLKNILEERSKVLSQISILYVEDDQDTLRIISDFLDDRIATLYTASDGEEGLVSFKKHLPDIVVSDIRMPRLDGIEMVKEIRKIDPDTPVMIITAHNDNDNLMKAIELGVNAYLTKPIDLIKFIKQVYNAVEPLVLKRELAEKNSMLIELNGTLKEKLLVKTDELDHLKDRLELAFSGTNDGIWDLNLLDNSIYYSVRWKEMLGYRDDEIENVPEARYERVHPDDIDQVWQDIYDNINRKTELYENEHRMQHKDGRWIWILDRGKTEYDASGKPIRMIGTHTDITEKKEIETRLRESEKNLLLAQEIAHLGNWAWNFETDILEWSDETFRIFGEEPQSFVPTYDKFLEYIPKEDRQNVIEAVAETLKDDTKVYDIIHQITHQDGTRKFVHEQGTLRYDVNKRPVKMMGTILDVTKHTLIEQRLEEQKRALHHQANHDALTGLPNRILFNDRLFHAIERARRSLNKLAVFFIDLDQFKQINDSLGHDIGDEVLRRVSIIFKNSLRKQDTLARMGGDEFMVILEDVKDTEDVSLVAQKMLDNLHEPLIIKGNPFFISCSIGISLYPNDGGVMKTLIQNADAAMYKSKEMGRNIYQYYTVEMTERAYERVLMEANLRNAIKNEEFMVFYQPQFNALNGRIVGLEALVRWNHPELGVISPARFLPLAQETDMILEIDQWVMKKAIKQMSRWHHKGYFPGRITLNVSMKTLYKSDVVANLEKVIERHGCIAGNIELEITEDHMMKDPEKSIAVLQRINEMGVRLAIDDFGTGYSSLAYLKRLPLDKLKIDQAFIRDLPYDDDDVAITRSIIALANSLKLDVIAEGVEKEEQKEFLVNNGCHIIQGYLYARPMPAEKLEELFNGPLQSPAWIPNEGVADAV